MLPFAARNRLDEDILDSMDILVIGAGGYVGGRLVPQLLAAGHQLTLASRQPAMVAHRFPDAKVLAADPLDPALLREIVRPVEIVYHLPETIVRHGSEAWGSEVGAARGIGEALASVGARRIIVLGKLAEGPLNSPSSRPGARGDRAEALALGGVPVLEFRASLVIGSGSATFEMVRHLADRVRMMRSPRWAEYRAQPIAVRDVLSYLLAALDRNDAGVVEIGGPEVLSFAEMLRGYARTGDVRGFRIPLPAATPWLSDALVSLLSPLPRGAAAAIIERLRHGVVVRDASAAATFPISPLTYAQAIGLALERTNDNQVETAWFDTFESRRSPIGTERESLDPPSPEAAAAGRRLLIDRRSLGIAADRDRVFAEVERLGGNAGWPAANNLWRLRGLVDRLVGGIGMRLGRRDQARLRVGDVVDFWRVEALERPRLLRLRADMRVPGRAWLEYEVEPTTEGSRLVQTAYFIPHGVAGYAYWYLLLPIHGMIFRAMVRVLAERASAGADAEGESVLKDGSRVAVLGGGPAGALFSTFALDMAARAGLRIEVDIYEPRSFEQPGPIGCNLCGGVISETLVQNLASDGLSLSTAVVQRGIDSYVLHTDVGGVRIPTPNEEMRIGGVHRGGGPLDVKDSKWESLDRHLLDGAVERGAHVIQARVEEVSRADGRPTLQVRGGAPQMYDLAVVATGVNTSILKAFEGLGIGYKRPQMTKTLIREYYLGEEAINASLGTSMHVFLLNIPRLEFAALIPKGDYVTMCLLGDEIDNAQGDAFASAPEVRAVMPAGWDPVSVSCQCLPHINVHGVEKPYADRVVFIGDAGVTRLYKDGIGAAYRTAKAAAHTVIFEGISERAFHDHYQPVCRSIRNDNRIGKTVFILTRISQRLPVLRRAIVKISHDEQVHGRRPRMSGILWDMFSGSASYRDILKRMIHPALIGRGILAVAGSLLPGARGREARAGKKAEPRTRTQT